MLCLFLVASFGLNYDVHVEKERVSGGSLKQNLAPNCTADTGSGREGNIDENQAQRGIPRDVLFIWALDQQ
jgi:hypothetical protein